MYVLILLTAYILGPQFQPSKLFNKTKLVFLLQTDGRHIHFVLHAFISIVWHPKVC